jgi:hypothetical protein
MSSGGLRTGKDMVGIEQQSRCGRVCRLVEPSWRERAALGSGRRADPRPPRTAFLGRRPEGWDGIPTAPEDAGGCLGRLDALRSRCPLARRSPTPARLVGASALSHASRALPGSRAFREKGTGDTGKTMRVASIQDGGGVRNGRPSYLRRSSSGLSRQLMVLGAPSGRLSRCSP